MERRGYLQRRGALAQLPFALLVARDGTRLHERADRLLDEERVPAGAGDDAIAKLRGDPLEGRLDDPLRLLVRERLENELGEVRAAHADVRRAVTRALREEQEDRYA